MLTSGQIKAIAGLLLDFGKIVFASLVVGAFLPGTAGGIAWPTFTGGLLVAFALVILGVLFSKDE